MTGLIEGDQVNSVELQKFKRDQPNVKLAKELADCVGRFVAMWITFAVMTYLMKRTGSLWFIGGVLLSGGAMLAYSIVAPMNAMTEWVIARQEKPTLSHRILMWLIPALALIMALSTVFAGEITTLMNDVLHSPAIPAIQAHS